MKELEQVLLPQTPDSQRRVFVLHGLGGIGKTQLAVQFARSNHTEFSAVLWLDGASEGSLKHSIALLTSRIPQGQISDACRAYTTGDGGDIEAAIKEVMGWLSEPDNSRWLLIFDNVDREHKGPNVDSEAYDVTSYFPEADHGAILITTRIANLGQLGAARKVDEVDKNTAQAIFRNWYGKDFGMIIHRFGDS
jgi:hypothetical protein